METALSAITRTSRSIRCAANRLVRRLTRKASIKLGITVSLQPFVKLVFDYSADIGEPANDNKPCHRPRHTA